MKLSIFQYNSPSTIYYFCAPFPFSLISLTIFSFYLTSFTAFFIPFSSNIFKALLKYL